MQQQTLRLIQKTRKRFKQVEKFCSIWRQGFQLCVTTAQRTETILGMARFMSQKCQDIYWQRAYSLLQTIVKNESSVEGIIMKELKCFHGNTPQRRSRRFIEVWENTIDDAFTAWYKGLICHFISSKDAVKKIHQKNRTLFSCS